MLKADLWGFLEDPRGGNGDIKDVRIRSVSKKGNSLALEKGHIKHAKQYQAPRDPGNLRREIRRSSGYAD